MENQDKNVLVLAPVDDGDERRTWLIEGVSQLDAFGGWGPKMIASPRNILRRLN